jgi:hypothetical protein
MAQRGFARRGMDDLQQRFFGRKPASAPEDNEPAADDRKKKKNSTEELIRQGLKGLFGR